MSPPLSSRRSFLQLSAFTAAHTLLPAQIPTLTSPAHANVAQLDRATILAQAQTALAASITPPPSPTFHTEIEPILANAGLTPQPNLLRAPADALLALAQTVAALTAATLLSPDPAFPARALAHLQPWFLAPATSLLPTFDQAGCAPNTTTGTPAGVVDLIPLASLARASSFLTDALTPADLATLQTWFRDALHWLQTNRQAYIAQESKDHRASAHLLLTAALARFLRDEPTLDDARKRFRSHILRQQIRPDGVFPQEVATPNPFRNTLFNFDLLAGACQLLSSPFDPLWDFTLIDEVGLRSVAAFLYPVITHPERWPFPADAHFFRDLPGRRPGLLLAGRAFNRPEYVTAWLSTPPVPPPPELAYSFPLHQPALFTARAPHGL